MFKVLLLSDVVKEVRQARRGKQTLTETGFSVRSARIVIALSGEKGETEREMRRRMSIFFLMLHRIPRRQDTLSEERSNLNYV